VHTYEAGILEAEDELVAISVVVAGDSRTVLCFQWKEENGREEL
jgi:hypothetical protein